jgi:hypothetical protein
LDVEPDLPLDNVTNPNSIYPDKEESENEDADLTKLPDNTLIKNKDRVNPSDLKRESGLKKKKKVVKARENFICEPNSLEAKIFNLMVPVLEKHASIGFQKFEVIHY